MQVPSTISFISCTNTGSPTADHLQVSHVDIQDFKQVYCFVVGIGKTTLIKKTCDALKSRHVPVQGFYTQECRQGSSRVGFDVVTLAGDRQPLARLPLVFTISLLYI